MDNNKHNQELDWELSGDFYQESENKQELRLEDFMEEELPEAGLAEAGGAANAEVQRVAADVRCVMGLVAEGKSIAQIAELMGVEPTYVSDIQICVQSFPEDNEIAVAHLILMG